MTDILAIFLIAAGNLADYITTKRALKRGARETNWLINQLGLTKVKVAFTVAQILLILAVPAPLNIIGGFVIFAFYAAVAWHNERQNVSKG